jgi:hypothetical protein
MFKINITKGHSYTGWSFYILTSIKIRPHNHNDVWSYSVNLLFNHIGRPSSIPSGTYSQLPLYVGLRLAKADLVTF